jgi:hypothetical protein
VQWRRGEGGGTEDHTGRPVAKQSVLVDEKLAGY